jgi:CheY-like chemotaxis protein
MNPPRLLLVEDDPALAELLEFRFRAEGYAVSVTPDGDEALLLAAEEMPDLVILDWMIEDQRHRGLPSPAPRQGQRPCADHHADRARGRG